MIYEKLMKIQMSLKAPKDKFNDYGKYYYRSCEGILEAVKPLCAEYKASLTIRDEIVSVLDRIYVKSVATLIDSEDQTEVSSVAFAREPMEKKGMDASQITGTASSYARKYALNGLFAIDDTKDADDLNTAPKDERSEKIKAFADADPRKFVCADCKKVITPAVNGRTEISVREIADGTLKRYGRCLCWECSKKAAGAQ